MMNSKTKQLLRSNFGAFAFKAYQTIYEGRSLDRDPYLDVFADYLQRVCLRKIRRGIVSMPPRHGKSFFASKCLPAFILLHDPSAQIIIISYEADLAEENARAVREIMRSDFYRQICRTRISKDHARVTDFGTTAGGRVLALSIEGGVTGKGADYIITDDLVEIKDCNNPKRLKRVNDLFDNEIRTRLNNPKRGCILVIAHRIAEDDLPGHLLAEGGWKPLRLPLIAPRARTYRLDNERVWHRRRGELLRPGAMTAREVVKLRASNRTPGFETLWQQNPRGEGRLNIKPGDFGTFSPETWGVSRLPVILSVDPGQRGGPGNSFSVIQAWAVADHAYLLFDQWREQAPYGDLRRKTNSFVKKYRPSVILIEDTAQGPALSSGIRHQRGMEIVRVVPVDNKVERLRRHCRLIRSGFIKLPDFASWRIDFTNEVTLFPLAEFDDQVDAMTQFLDWVVANPTPTPRPPRLLGYSLNNSYSVPLSYQPRVPTVPVPWAALAPRLRRR